MKENSTKNIKPLLIVCLLIFLGGLSIIMIGTPSSNFLREQRANTLLKKEKLNLSPILDITQRKLVEQYIVAYQGKDCEKVSGYTLWIQERLHAIHSNPSYTAAGIKEQESILCEQLFVYDRADARMNILGLDDQYLMVRASQYTLLSADSGRVDLEKSVLERVWVQFVYSNPATAPKTQNGAKPIYSLIAGINISESHLILKGAVRGSWEVDLNSISTQW